MPDAERPNQPVPRARAVPKRRTHLSLVWLIPIVAAIAGAWVAVTRILARGPAITIVFKSAEGLEAGKTTIHYNGVDVGIITAVRLSDDHRDVVATAQMASSTDGLLVEDTTFWIVSPRISGANITGLGTLISGAYVGMEIGQSSVSRRSFVALNTPPVVTGDVAGRFFLLKAQTLGSLDDGVPVYFRQLQVGQVASYDLDPDGESLSIKVFVKAPYDQYVTMDTRFWNASGFDVSLSASGVNFEAQSLLSILVGGVAFETPPSGAARGPAAENTVFSLFDSRAEAFRLPPRNPQIYKLVFSESVRGLSVGAPVEFQGIQIGQVVEINAQVDARTFQFSAPVTVQLDPLRMGVDVVDLPPGVDLATVRQHLVGQLIQHGVRAQLRTGNLLTGSLFVAFDFFPEAGPVAVDWSRKPVELPTVPGQLQELQAHAASIVKKLDQVDYRQIGDDLRRALADLDKTLASARAAIESGRVALDNANRLVAPDAELGEQLGTTLAEVARAARSLRVLADYLERHPEALLRGKPGEAKE